LIDKNVKTISIAIINNIYGQIIFSIIQIKNPVTLIISQIAFGESSINENDDIIQKGKGGRSFYPCFYINLPYCFYAEKSILYNKKSPTTLRRRDLKGAIQGTTLCFTTAPVFWPVLAREPFHDIGVELPRPPPVAVVYLQFA
jgi:hypothetical protein